MITEAIFRPLLWLFDSVMGLLPQWEPELPSGLQTVASKIAEYDSVIPIGGPLRMAATALLLGGTFLTIRMILVVRHVALP